MIRVKAQMVTLLDGFCAALTHTHSRNRSPYLSHRLLARRENYTPVDSDLYHVLLGSPVIVERLAFKTADV